MTSKAIFNRKFLTKHAFFVVTWLIGSVCNAELWSYSGESAALVPSSTELGSGWSRSLIRTVNERNELNQLFQSTSSSQRNATTNYEIFRRTHGIGEFSEVEYLFVDETQKCQRHHLSILVFEDSTKLQQFWKTVHPEQTQAVFTTESEETNQCIFRISNVYVRVSSDPSTDAGKQIAESVYNRLIADKNADP